MADIPRLSDGDVVELILADHRWFEDTLRGLRDETSDRAALLADLSAVLVAHAKAEEAKVYPALRRKDAIDARRKSSTPSTSTTRATKPCWSCSRWTTPGAASSATSCTNCPRRCRTIWTRKSVTS